MKNYLLKEGEMNIYILLNLILFLLFNSLIHCQSLGVSVGYGYTNMKEVNNIMKHSQDIISTIGETISLSDDVTEVKTNNK